MAEPCSPERDVLASSPPPSPSPPASPARPSSPYLDLDLNTNRDDGVSDDLMVQNGLNFKRSAAPARIMFYEEQSWEDFQGIALECLRSGFLEGKPILPLEIEGTRYAIDFLRMEQVDLGSGNQRSIAWFDDKGNPFFPKRFVDDDLLRAQIVKLEDEYGKLDKGIKRILTEVEDNGGLGSKRQSLDLALAPPVVAEPFKFPNAKLLSKNDKTYAFVSNMLMSNIVKADPNTVITDIHEFQILAPLARARWEVVEKQIEITEATRGKANVVYAWYAAPAEEVASIFSHGFKSPTNPNGFPVSYGAGIYLADVESPYCSAMQLPQVEKDDEKHIIFCRVVLGSVEKIELEFQQTCPSREEFDTGSDNPENPRWYVVWNTDINKRILPVCVVTCKTSGFFPVNWKAYKFENPAVPKLVLEMKKRIPFSNVQALGVIYDAFKFRELDRDSFMKHLRAITGDHMLLNTAKEIFGLG